MGLLKKNLDYVDISKARRPGPKNGHLSQLDPVYAQIEKPVDKQLKAVWAGSKSVDDLKTAFGAAAPLPADCPQPDRDVKIWYSKATVRDGAQLELKVYQSVNVQKNAALVFRMHGGGWVVGNHLSEETENRYIAAAVPSAIVVSVLYRMAPEFPFPTALNDSFDALKWCKSNAKDLGINPEKIILAGCSAGGNLAITTAIKARDEGLTGIIGQHISIPVTCHPKFFDQVPNNDKYELLSYVQNADASVINAAQMEFFWDCYVGTNPKADVYHSPLLSRNLKGLPPAVVQVAGLDPLRDEGIAYGEALKAAGVPTEIYTYQGVPHGFYGFYHLKSAQDYYARAIDFVKKLAGGERALL